MGKKLFMLIPKGVAQLTLCLGTWLLKFYHNLKAILNSQFLVGLVLPFRSYVSNRNVYSETGMSNRQKLKAKIWIKVNHHPKKRTDLMAQKKKKNILGVAVQFWACIWLNERSWTNQNTCICLPISEVWAIVLLLDKNAYNLIQSPASFDWPGLIQT